MEVALDLALQCAPDHPWAKEHPEWFTVKSDGSIAYAENPPKKYQDIYPINFDSDPEGIYAEVLRVVRHWMSHGVRIFRVDNPHTKPVAFWERLIAEIKATEPDVLFLAEAFTRPPMMHTLGQDRLHPVVHVLHLAQREGGAHGVRRRAQPEAAGYMRPNFFVNTPDILHAYLQYGGPAAFKIRAVLAALLSPSWGVYSGYELFEHVPVRPGSEEYLDSEKYQYRPRDWAAPRRGPQPRAVPHDAQPGPRANIRRCTGCATCTFHSCDQPEILAFSKTSTDGRARHASSVVVNLDPHATRETTVHLDMAALGHDWSDETFDACDEVTGQSFSVGRAPLRATRPVHRAGARPHRRTYRRDPAGRRPDAEPAGGRRDRRILELPPLPRDGQRRATRASTRSGTSARSSTRC